MEALFDNPFKFPCHPSNFMIYFFKFNRTVVPVGRIFHSFSRVVKLLGWEARYL